MILKLAVASRSERRDEFDGPKSRPSAIQTVDLFVYRAAGGAGPYKRRRLRLGGKLEPAGCDEIKDSASSSEMMTLPKAEILNFAARLLAQKPALRLNV